MQIIITRIKRSDSFMNSIKPQNHFNLGAKFEEMTLNAPQINNAPPCGISLAGYANSFSAANNTARKNPNDPFSARNRHYEDPFDNAENDIRSALAHLSNKIWIRDIQIIPPYTHTMWTSQALEKIIVNCEPQGNTLENEELASLVEEAISLHGNLRIEEITIHPVIHAKAVEKVREDTYLVKPYFAEFLAENENYRKFLIKTNVKDVHFELRQTGRQTYTPTGKILTDSIGKEVTFNSNNIYHVIAQSFTENVDLRNKIITEDVESVSCKFTKDGNIIFNVTSNASFKLPMPKPATINADVSKATNPQKDIQLDKQAEAANDSHSPSFKRF